MGLSFWQILLVVVLLVLLFGRGKIPALMSDVAAGIKGFRKEMDGDNTDKGVQDTAPDQPDKTLPESQVVHAASDSVPAESSTKAS